METKSENYQNRSNDEYINNITWESHNYLRKLYFDNQPLIIDENGNKINAKILPIPDGYNPFNDICEFVPYKNK